MTIAKGDNYCEMCGETLKPDRAVWLELNMLTGKYRKAGTGEDWGDASQGCFTFGAACAKKALAGKEFAHQI